MEGSYNVEKGSKRGLDKNKNIFWKELAKEKKVGQVMYREKQLKLMQKWFIVFGGDFL